MNRLLTHSGTDEEHKVSEPARTLCIAEHRVIISDEAVDTNSLHSALQVVEILFKKLIFGFLIASDMG